MQTSANKRAGRGYGSRLAGTPAVVYSSLFTRQSITRAFPSPLLLVVLHVPLAPFRFVYFLHQPPQFIPRVSITLPAPITHPSPSTNFLASQTSNASSPSPILAAATAPPQRIDEDLINRSLLDSIDADHPSSHSLASIDTSAPHLSYSYIPRHPSPPPMSRLPFSDPYTSQDDYKRTFGRQSFSQFNQPINPVTGSHQHIIAPPFRDSTPQQYPLPTAIDVFGPPDPLRAFDFREPSRDYSINKPSQPHHPYHNGAVSHQTQTVNGHHHGHRDDEISTIFVVGFPDDMQEREFQNMFTFSKGFEAASLKVPHKELPPAPANGVNGSYPHSGSYHNQQDSYNVVTPGGMSAETPTTPWAPPLPQPSQEDIYGQQQQQHSNHTLPPRKQIIGFAKFRTRSEALEARDLLQGRKVDVERGAVLKAEMAKKNLHTKRGPGPSGLPLSMVGPGGMVGADTLASLSGLPGGAASLPTHSSGEVMRDRERELGALGAMGLGFLGNSAQRHRDRENNGDREREASVPTKLRFGSAESNFEGESNYQQRLQDKLAFEAFHAVPPNQQARSAAHSGPRSVLSPTESSSSLSPGHDGTGFTLQMNGHVTTQQGLWGPPPPQPQPTSSSQESSPNTDISNFPPSFSGLSLSSSPPPTQSVSAQSHPTRSLTYSSSSEHLSSNGQLNSHPASSSSSVTGSRGSVDGDSETTRNPITGVEGQESSGSGSPSEFTSPVFGVGTLNRMNSTDQNPPINTLYVGNLPTSPPPPGMSPNYLEDNLRALFAQCPGYRKLCYKYQNKGPMCFVEFDDVAYATKALNELYGNQLNGLVKSGIRLSYSKNPLGVRSGGSISHGSHNGGYHHTNQWSSVSNANASEGRLSSNGSFSLSQDAASNRVGEPQMTTQRPLSHRDSVSTATELSPNAPQYSFMPLQSPSAPTSRFFSTTTNGLFSSNNTTSKTPTTRVPSVFSPFQATDTNLTPREHNNHPLTPSPGLETARPA